MNNAFILNVSSADNVLRITDAWVAELARLGNSNSSTLSTHNLFGARVIVPDYCRKIRQHYGLGTEKQFLSLCAQRNIGIPFRNFGVLLTFSKSAELALFDEQQRLDTGMRLLLDAFGLVVIHNACLDAYGRGVEHRARFQHLNFHRDRDPSQSTCYSLYSRSPHCEQQREPRTSSTLFAANLVAELQIARENPSRGTQGISNHYQIFGKENISTLVGEVMVEHSWNQPRGVGELSILNNRTLLHSSYYRDPAIRDSYRIGVRYLA